MLISHYLFLQHQIFLYHVNILQALKSADQEAAHHPQACSAQIQSHHDGGRHQGHDSDQDLVNGVEISSWRAGSDPEKFDPAGFPESDLARRDFTINAMAYDPLVKKIIDPFNGRKDLEDGSRFKYI